MSEDIYSIAIDGPSGAGKSTIAKGLAKRLNIVYVDTGAMYRAVGLKVLRAGGSPDDTPFVIGLLPSTVVTIKFSEGVQRVFLDGEDVSGLIRTQEVSNAASKVSAIPEVRFKLVELQKKLAENTSVTMDGRDIGSYVLPGSRYKFYVTASPEARTIRRYRELEKKGALCGIGFNELLLEMIERDKRDSGRDCMPLKKAPDAILVDTTYLGIEESIDAVMKYIKVGG